MRRALLLTASFVVASTAALAGAARPDLGSVSPGDRRLIERACEVDRGTDGYDACVGGELEALKHVKIPDLAGLAPDERKLLEKACGLEQALEGPASFYTCANRFLDVIHDSLGDLGMADKAARAQSAPKQPHLADDGPAVPPPHAVRPANHVPRPAQPTPPATPPRDVTDIPALYVLLVVFGVACVAAVFLVRFNRETCDECGSSGKLNELGVCAACMSKDKTDGPAASRLRRPRARGRRTRRRDDPATGPDGGSD